MFADCLKQAKRKINLYIKQNNQRLTFPELFTPTCPIERSPLHWNLDKFTKRDLLELVAALEAAQVFRDVNNHSASFTSIVECFEHLGNISVTNIHKQREAILCRKKGVAEFLSRLQRALCEKV